MKQADLSVGMITIASPMKRMIWTDITRIWLGRVNTTNERLYFKAEENKTGNSIG